MPETIYRGQAVLYWPDFMIDPPSDGNACVGLITQVDDAASGIVRIGGYNNEGRPLIEGQRCSLVNSPTAGGWMPLS